MSRYSHVSRVLSTRCTVELASGEFCDAERAPDMPFAICGRHAIQVYRVMQAMVTEVQTNHRDYPEVHNVAVRGIGELKNHGGYRVYYLRVGSMIKIGVTSDLHKRIANYPPGSELLAVERGGEDLESRRLCQFRHLLADRKEWFHPGPDLLDHIATLAATAA